MENIYFAVPIIGIIAGLVIIIHFARRLSMLDWPEEKERKYDCILIGFSIAGANLAILLSLIASSDLSPEKSEYLSHFAVFTITLVIVIMVLRVFLIVIKSFLSHNDYDSHHDDIFQE